METSITRPIDTEKMLGFDERGQLWAAWEDHGNTYNTLVPDLRYKFCFICRCGWPSNSTSFRDNFHTGEVFGFVHKRCWTGHLTLAEHRMWQELLIATGFVPFDMKVIPNEYGGAWNLAWYEISFRGFVPKMKLGTRKNVYHLSMHDLSDKQVKMASGLFKEVKSTNWATTAQHEAGVHAWDKEAAKEHLSCFRRVLTLDKPLRSGTLEPDVKDHGK